MVSEYFKLRNGIYALIARPYYKESTAGYLTELRQYLPVFVNLNLPYAGRLDEAMALLEKATATTTPETIKAHAMAFTRLFLNVAAVAGMKSLCPTESGYMSGSGLVMQKQRDEVMEIYYENNVHTPHFTEPEDHLTAELKFMALLGNRCLEALSQKDIEQFNINIDTQISFMEKHLLQWIKPFTEDLYALADECKSPDYFKGIALLTDWFVHGDYHLLCAIRANSTELLAS